MTANRTASTATGSPLKESFAARLFVCALALAFVTTGASVGAEKPAEAAPKAFGAAELVRGFRSDLVLVEGKSGRGSAFIGLLKGRKFLITNAHVIAGIKDPHFKTLDNAPVKLDSAAAVAVGHDIVIWGVAQGGTGIPIVGAVATDAAIGDEVVVPGNAGGEGVVNAVAGKIVGIGPNLVEVSAPIEAGSSGSPVIHMNSGKALGVATYLSIKSTDQTQGSSGSAQATVRRFGYRLDSVAQWQPINWPKFYTEAGVVEKLEQTSAELIQALLDLRAASKSRRATRTYAYDSPAIRGALDNYYAELAAGAGNGPEASRTLLTSLRAESQSGVSSARASLSYDYFRRQFEEEGQKRKELMEIFDKALAQ